MSERSIEFEVHALPAPQGSKRAFVNRKTGKAVVVEQTLEHTRSWRGAVVEAAEKAIYDAVHTGPLMVDWWVPMRGPLMLSVIFAFPRPKSHFGTGRNAAVLKPSAPERPTGGRVGDLSKLVRATEDALTDAGVWEDDSQVAELAAAKVYAGTGRCRVPGAWILVDEGLLTHADGNVRPLR